MFGHQNDQQDEDQAVNNDGTLTPGQDMTQPDPAVAPAPATDQVYTPPADATFTPPPATEPPVPDSLVMPAPAVDADVAARAPEPPTVDTNGLLDIKQQALGQLSPLIGHLDQTPVERFRTMMMMIQASDNQGLIKDAYAAAQSIEDEKTRAQALLDVINEINYFTQHNEA